MQLSISNEQGELPVDEAQCSLLRDALSEVLATEPSGPVTRMIGDQEAEVSLVLVDDARMASLNQQYRGLAGTTDVLSFPMLDADEAGLEYAVAGQDGTDPATGPELLLGDIVISVPQALKQAAGYGNSLQQELIWLAVHGMLHLLGYDDATDLETARMMERAYQVLDKLGLGAVRDV